MNPTNFDFPSDIVQYTITDFRPNKALYVNVNNNNKFRLYMQRNATQIMKQGLTNYVRTMNGRCEKNVSCIKAFDSSELDSIAR